MVPRIYLAKLVVGMFPYYPAIWGPRSCEAAIIWADICTGDSNYSFSQRALGPKTAGVFKSFGVSLRERAFEPQKKPSY